MSPQRRVLLLVGSARRPRSTSESLGSYLMEWMGERGFETETLLLPRVVFNEERSKQLTGAVEGAQVVVLAFPLYVDSLPYVVTRALELIAQHRISAPNPQRQRLLCIVNNGFPEAYQNDTAVAICRQFARESGFDWAGGLTLGGGGMIDGQPLEKLGGRAFKVTRALDLAAAALVEGRPVPEEALAMMATPVIPSWVYTLFGDFGWKQRAKKHGVQRRLRDRPYADAGQKGTAPLS